MEGIRWGDWPQSSLTNQCDQIEITSHLRVIHFLYIHHEILWWSSHIKIWFCFFSCLLILKLSYVLSMIWWQSPSPLFLLLLPSPSLSLSLSLSLTVALSLVFGPPPGRLLLLSADWRQNFQILFEFWWQFLWRIFAFNDSCNFLLILR